MIASPFASFTRPADVTAYAANDLVANSTTAGSVTPMEFAADQVAGNGIVRRATLHKSTATATLASFTLHLFTVAPVVTNGDNGAFAVSTAENYVGTVAIDMATGALAGTNSLWKDSAAVAWPIRVPGNGKLYGLLAASAGYTPASAEVFKVTLHIEGC